MKIVITTFGLPRAVLEKDWFEIEVAENATIADLMERLNAEFTQLFGFKSLAMYVNGETVPSDFKLSEGDKVFFVPPMEGG